MRKATTTPAHLHTRQLAPFALLSVVACLCVRPVHAADWQLQVPPLAYDAHSISLVWHKPANYQQLRDFRVYMNGQLLGSAADNNTAHSVAKPYIDQFYAADSQQFHTRVLFHNFTVTGLQPSTAYTFTVRAVDAAGRESDESAPLRATTAPAYARVVYVAEHGAVGDGRTVNTRAIQQAIDSCAHGSTSAYGCKVVIGAHTNGAVLVSGALFLRSNMTLEIAEGATLKGSATASDYPLGQGYQIYSYFTNSTDDRRPPSLLNVLSEAHRNGSAPLADHQGYDETRAAFQNIRIVGAGTIDGRGWQRAATDTTDELGRGLAFFPPGNAQTWQTLGLLAKSQMQAAADEVGGGMDSTQNFNYYNNRRSSLATFRGVRNMYFGGGLKLLNPAFHGVMFLESEQLVFANTVTQTFDINNADGVEFGNSDTAFVYNNFVDSGDDNINFAAGQGREYEAGQPQKNAWIFNNYLREGHGAVALGSHTGAWIEDVLAEDNVLFLTDNGLRIKSTPATGGGVRHIVFRDNALRNVGTQNSVTVAGHPLRNNTVGSPVVLTLAYAAGSNVFHNASQAARFEDITVENVSVDNVSTASGGPVVSVDGYAGKDSALPYPETWHRKLVLRGLRTQNALPMRISRVHELQWDAAPIPHMAAP